jgi:hypothetical protein
MHAHLTPLVVPVVKFARACDRHCRASREQDRDIAASHSRLVVAAAAVPGLNATQRARLNAAVTAAPSWFVDAAVLPSRSELHTQSHWQGGLYASIEDCCHALGLNADTAVRSACLPLGWRQSAQVWRAHQR